MADIKLAALSSCNEIYSLKLVLPLCHFASRNQTAHLKRQQHCFIRTLNQQLESKTTWAQAAVLKGVEAASHEELGKMLICFFSRRAFGKNSRGVRSCLNYSFVVRPTIFFRNLSEIVHFKSHAPGPNTKGTVWEESRGTHAQRPHHTVEAAVMIHAVSNTVLILQFNTIQVYRGSHPNVR